MAYHVGHMTDVDVAYAAVRRVPDGTSTYRSPVPRKPYRSPREWLPADQRRFFGWGTNPNWPTPDGELERALVAAPKQQSHLAYSIRVRITRAMTMRDLAASIDVHADTVRDLLNGSQHANLATLHALSNAVGLTTTTTISTISIPTAESDPT